MKDSILTSYEKGIEAALAEYISQSVDGFGKRRDDETVVRRVIAAFLTELVKESRTQK